jgi:hypothetical protein
VPYLGGIDVPLSLVATDIHASGELEARERVALRALNLNTDKASAGRVDNLGVGRGVCEVLGWWHR